MSNQRVMPDWMYDAGPVARGFVNSLNKIMTNPGSTGISPNDLIINQTPLGSIRDMESIYNNGLNKLPPAFLNAMGSGTGRAVSYGLAGMAGLGALIPMMARGGGAHPMLSPPKAPTVADFISSSPTVFGRQEPMLDVGSVSDYGLPVMLRNQAGSVGSYGKPNIYHRYTKQDKSPFNDVDYAMFAKDRSAVENAYGRNYWTADDSNAVDASSLIDDLEKALDKRPDILDEYQVSARELATEFDPSDIVNSAGGFDAPNLVQILYEEVLASKGIDKVRTSNGLVIFNKDLIKKMK